MPKQKTFSNAPHPKNWAFALPFLSAALGVNLLYGGGGAVKIREQEGGDESFRSPLLDATSAEPGCLISQHKSVTVICGGGGGRVLFPCSKSET